MFLGEKKAIEDHLVELLYEGSVLILDLIEEVNQRRPGTTKQAVYSALRRLAAQEVVLVHNGHASLNLSWLSRINEFTELAQHHYHVSGKGHFLGLQEGESIRYSFKDALATDAFWNHSLMILSKAVPDGEAFFAYDPDAWFYLIHPEKEKRLRSRLLLDGHRYHVLVGSTTSMDSMIASEFDGLETQYHMLETPLFPDQRYYLNLLGDYIVEVHLDAVLAQRVEDFYQNNRSLSPAQLGAFRALLAQKAASRLRISRNATRAKNLRKKFQKYFL